MMRIGLLIIAMSVLTGCYEKTPSDSEAIEIAKQELSMALCGNRSASCIEYAKGKAKISARLNNNTNNISVSFSEIRAKTGASTVIGLDKFNGGGLVAYVFDAKSGSSYVKDISLWSKDGTKSINLCGHNYRFCKK